MLQTTADVFMFSDAYIPMRSVFEAGVLRQAYIFSVGVHEMACPSLVAYSMPAPPFALLHHRDEQGL